MNKHNAKDYLPLVQAWAEGKEIQHRHAAEGTWGDIVYTTFSDEPDCYRIKPEPRIVWIPPENVMDFARYCKDRAQAEERVRLYGGHIAEVTE